MKCLLLILLSLLSVAAHAGVYGEVNGYYSSDIFTTATTATNSKTYYSLDIHSNLENKSRFYAGFHVDQVNLIEENGAASSSTLTSLNMGPMAMWVIDHRKTFSLAAGYNLLANGTYTVTGSSAATLTGTSLWGSFGVMPEVTDNLYIGFRVTYYSLSYAKSTTGAAAADVAYTRNLIFPAFALAWRY